MNAGDVVGLVACALAVVSIVAGCVAGWRLK